MPTKVAGDAPPPSGWPHDVVYLNKQKLDPTFPAQLVPFLCADAGDVPAKYAPQPYLHPAHVQIKKIGVPGHPAHGQNGLFAKKRIDGGCHVIAYIGIIHHTFTPAEGLPPSESPGVADDHEGSDYDLSLVRISASDPRNPFTGQHVSIGVDAARAGNAGRFVNDYRGIADKPNAEFRLGKEDSGHLRMEVWSLKQGLSKGEEVLVSYGKGWWGARQT